jgi:hypothetical protein
MIKFARPPYIPGAFPERQEVSREARLGALKDVGLAGAAGLGLAGGAVALREVLRKLLGHQEKPVPSGLGAIDVSLPTKHAAATPVGGAAEGLSGARSLSTGEVPWRIPAAIGAGAAGLLGGKALIDYVLKKRRKHHLQHDLDSANREFNSAIAVPAGKSAAALDRAFDALEKSGALGELAGQIAGDPLVGGAVLGLGGISAALMGRAAYKSQKDKLLRKHLADAIDRRRRLRALQGPPEIFVRPIGSKGGD